MSVSDFALFGRQAGERRGRRIGIDAVIVTGSEPFCRSHFRLALHAPPIGAARGERGVPHDPVQPGDRIVGSWPLGGELHE